MMKQEYTMKNTEKNNYDFTTVINRDNTNSLKWDSIESELPMWVADMDFKTASEIQESLKKRINHPIYGYTTVPNELYESYIQWWEDNYHIKMKKEELLYARGVMPSIISIIRKLTKPLDNIIIQTPVYNAFFNVILNNNRKVLENQLTYKNYEYSINFKDLENKLKNPKTSLMLLCNPHNPIGKIWGKNDLEKIGSLCEKYNVILVSDEIHCDLTYPGKTYTPFASLASSIVDNSITCISPSKTFNIAGIQSAMVYIKNKELNLKVSQQLYADFSSEPNILSVEATITAYTQCREWLNQLKNTLLENKIIVEDFLKKELPSIKLVPVMPLTYYG